MNGHPKVWGSIAAIESILSNLITNAVNVFIHYRGGVRDREMQITSSVSDGQVILSIADNGPGIFGMAVEDIWLPGHTTIPGGTGLGLTIVRDTTIDLGGQVAATPNGKLGGAEIIITLPQLEATR